MPFNYLSTTACITHILFTYSVVIMSNKPYRPGTPILNQNRNNKTDTTTISSITNEDIMAAILSVQTTQTEQFHELRNSIKSLTSDIIVLKSEIFVLRSELVSIKAKVGDLESNTSKHGYENTVVQMLRESMSAVDATIIFLFLV